MGQLFLWAPMLFLDVLSSLALRHYPELSVLLSLCSALVRPFWEHMLRGDVHVTGWACGSELFGTVLSWVFKMQA